MACGLVAGQFWKPRVVLRGMSMPGRVLSVHFRKDMSVHACAIGGLVIFKNFCRYVEASLGFS
jgi:hypothetical protein